MDLKQEVTNGNSAALPNLPRLLEEVIQQISFLTFTLVLTLLQSFKVVFISNAASIHKSFTLLRCSIEEEPKDECPTWSRICWLRTDFLWFQALSKLRAGWNETGSHSETTGLLRSAFITWVCASHNTWTRSSYTLDHFQGTDLTRWTASIVDRTGWLTERFTSRLKNLAERVCLAVY